MAVPSRGRTAIVSWLAVALTLVVIRGAAGQLPLGPAEFVQAGGSDIAVPGYSVPRFDDWNDDDLPDLIIGEGSSLFPAKVRVYLNSGMICSPEFGDYVYAQSDGEDLSLAGSGCLGVAPLVVYWDADDRKDLLVGRSDGKVAIYLNTGTDDEPTFDGGTLLQVGPDTAKVDIDVGSRAVPDVADWNDDGRKDLIVGDLGGVIEVFINDGTDTAPDFIGSEYAQLLLLGDVTVPSGRSSPQVVDWDGDGLQDLLSGNTSGQLLFYRNVGTAEAPSFADYLLVEAGGVPIDLPGTPRSRPGVCDWTADGAGDVLIGSGDGTVRLYQAVTVPSDHDHDGDIDLADYDVFEECLGGPAGAPADCCFGSDLDDDGDADLVDFAAFQRAFTG